MILEDCNPGTTSMGNNCVKGQAPAQAEMRLETSAETSKEPVLFSTEEVDQAQRVSHWEQRFGLVWGAIKVWRDRSDFLGRIETFKFGHLRLNRIALRGLNFRRLTSAPEASQFFALDFPQKGLAVVERRGCELLFRPGSMYFVRHGEPDETHVREEYETLNVQIPVQLLKNRIAKLPELSRWNAIETGMPMLVQHLVWDLFEQTQFLCSSEIEALSGQLCDLIGLLLTDSRASSSADTSVLRAHRNRALHYMEQNLHDSFLAPEQVASTVGLSLSYLNKIFAAFDLTVMGELRRIRLTTARRMLHSAQFTHFSISEIAFRSGFKSLSDFSRAFRQSFGLSPTQFRAQRDSDLSAQK